MTMVYSDNNFTVPINGLNCMKFSINRTSNVIGAPVESGQKSFDNKVRNPVEVKVTGIVELANDIDGYADFAISKINEMYANREFKFYSVQTEYDSFKNLILKDCPYTIDQNQPDFMVYELTFVEAMLVQNVSYTPANRQNTNTNAGGARQPSTRSYGRGNMAIMR